MAALLLVLAACAPPPKTIAVVQSPTPSPSPTPTTSFAASGPGFHAGEVGLAYPVVPLSAAGGVQPYKWWVVSGALPGGLNLRTDGTVDGTPTSAGHYTFTIRAADSGDSTDTIAGTINIASRLTASLIPACASTCNVELGCANACGSFGQVTGGLPPYTYAVKEGPLPAGTKLSSSSLTLNGTFGGKPGYLQFTAQVGDGLGAMTTISPTFWMYPHIGLASGACTGRATCVVKLAYSGGVPGPAPSVATTGWKGGSCSVVAVVTCPPHGFSAAIQPGVVSITLTWSANSPMYNGALSVQITDPGLCGPGVDCTSVATVKVN